MNTTMNICSVYSMCRVCTITQNNLPNDCNLIDIFSLLPSESISTSIATAIMECAPVQISPDDGLPELICTDCISKLLMAQQFRSLCVQSEIQLKQQFITNKFKTGKEEPKGPTYIITDIYSVETIDDKITVSDAVTFSCDGCFLSFSSRKELADHEVAVHPGMRPYECEKCGKTFKQKMTLKYHMDKHTGTRPYKCDKCHKTFIRFSHFKLHVKGHEIKEDSGNIDDLPKKDNCSSNINKNNKFQCSLCKKAYRHANQLKIHSRVHTGDRPFSCSVCHKRFMHNSVLKTHARTHSGERRHVCQLCRKPFYTRWDLGKHMATHTDALPYACDVCNKKFKQRGYLVVHKRSHTGERPYVCDVCGKGFTQTGPLTVHKRTHTGEKPFSCSVCNKSCNTDCDLRKHMMTHSDVYPFSCDVCDKYFKWNSNLIKHRRLHTGERPYKCTFCAKGFADSGRLKVHLAVHTDVRGFKCDACAMQFKTKANLKKHKDKVHVVVLDAVVLNVSS